MKSGKKIRKKVKFIDSLRDLKNRRKVILGWQLLTMAVTIKKV